MVPRSLGISMMRSVLTHGLLVSRELPAHAVIGHKLKQSPIRSGP